MEDNDVNDYRKVAGINHNSSFAVSAEKNSVQIWVFFEIILFPGSR